MQMSALDTDCTSGIGKIHAFTLNFPKLDPVVVVYVQAHCVTCVLHLIFTIFNRICRTA